MNHEKRVEIGKVWIALAQMYGREIPKDSLSLMLNSISDLDPNGVLIVLEEWAKSSKTNRHPLPSDIREKLNPKRDSDAEAKEAASRIVAGVSKFGWTQPEEAKSWIGELGWRVVNRFGGWLYICENLGTTLDVTSFQAQARDLARATITRSDMGLDNQPPQLQQNNDKLKLLLSIMKGETNATTPTQSNDPTHAKSLPSVHG